MNERLFKFLGPLALVAAANYYFGAPLLLDGYPHAFGFFLLIGLVAHFYLVKVKSAFWRGFWAYVAGVAVGAAIWWFTDSESEGLARLALAIAPPFIMIALYSGLPVRKKNMPFDVVPTLVFLGTPYLYSMPIFLAGTLCIFGALWMSRRSKGETAWFVAHGFYSLLVHAFGSTNWGYVESLIASLIISVPIVLIHDLHVPGSKKKESLPPTT